MEFRWNADFRRWCCAATLIAAPVVVLALAPSPGQLAEPDSSRKPAAAFIPAARIPAVQDQERIERSQFTVVPYSLLPLVNGGNRVYRLPPIGLIQRIPPVARKMPAAIVPESPPRDVTKGAEASRSILKDRWEQPPLAPSDPLALIPPKLEHDWSDPRSPMPSVAEQASQAVRRASNLARRGATYSSADELEGALALVVQSLDTHYATTAFTKCFRAGQLALEEAADFAPSQGGRSSSLDVSAIVSRHQSRILSPKETRELSPAEAARRYYSYAQEHLAAAVGGAPIAAHALFGLGKLYSAKSQPGSDTERIYEPRAVVMQQTALRVSRTHALAAYELGGMLARQGRLAEARELLQYGLAVGAPPDAWRSLADVHERMGEMALANEARSAWQRTAQRSPSQQVTAWNGTTIQWVDKKTFERGSLDGVAPPSGGQPTLQATPAGPILGSPPASAPHMAVQPAHPAMGRW